MKLVLSIFLFSLIGYLFVILGPIIGGCLAFGVVVGGLFRGLDDLDNINRKLTRIVSADEDLESNPEAANHMHHLKDSAMYLKYLKEKQINAQENHE